MKDLSLVGLPWWAWVLIAVVVWIVVAQVRKASAKSTHRAEQERLAQIADAEHEGAKTRHEGGA